MTLGTWRGELGAVFLETHASSFLWSCVSGVPVCDSSRDRPFFVYSRGLSQLVSECVRRAAAYVDLVVRGLQPPVSINAVLFSVP